MPARLAEILEDQLAEAKAKAGLQVHRRLKNGLRIVMMYSHPHVMLMLAREIVFPDMKEWETVMKYFPYDTPKVTPEPKQSGKYFTISAKLPSAHQLKF